MKLRHLGRLEIDPPLLHVLQLAAVCLDMAVATKAGLFQIVALSSWDTELDKEPRGCLEPQRPVTVRELCYGGAQRLLSLHKAPDTRQLLCDWITGTDLEVSQKRGPLGALST